MVPHRTKLRELIIQAWKQYFQVLRHDLAVCDPYLVSWVFLILLTRRQWDGFLLLRMYGLIKIADLS